MYYPFGEVRWASAEMPTDFGYTGQRLDGMGLMFYHTRYYAPSLGRFIQADTIVPNLANPQSFNRYSYVENRPVQLIDPSGHDGRSISAQYPTLIEDIAGSTYATYQLVVDRHDSFPHLPYLRRVAGQGSTISPILLGAAMDRQNAARHAVVGGIQELFCSMLPSMFFFTGDKASIGPANIEMREIRRWVNLGWLDKSVLEGGSILTNAQLDLVGDPSFAIQAMRIKLHEADWRISFFGGNNVDPTERFMLLMIAQNKLEISRIQNFFKYGAEVGWGKYILSKKDGVNEDQFREMMENILRLQSQGWTLPAGVDLWKYWDETLRPSIEKEYPELCEAVDRMR
jgi:RHS repeat-associated protein